MLGTAQYNAQEIRDSFARILQKADAIRARLNQPGDDLRALPEARISPAPQEGAQSETSPGRAVQGVSLAGAIFGVPEDYSAAVQSVGQREPSLGRAQGRGAERPDTYAVQPGQGGPWGLRGPRLPPPAPPRAEAPAFAAPAAPPRRAELPRVATDSRMYLLLRVTGLTLSRGLEALSPMGSLSSARLLVSSAPNPVVELSEHRFSALFPAAAFSGADFVLEGFYSPEVDSGSGDGPEGYSDAYDSRPQELTVRLASGRIEASLVTDALYTVRTDGSIARRYSRSRVSLVRACAVPLHAVPVSGAYSGPSSAIQGSLVVGCLECEIFCGGETLLRYEGSLGGARAGFLALREYTSERRRSEAGVETDELEAARLEARGTGEARQPRTRGGLGGTVPARAPGQPAAYGGIPDNPVPSAVAADGAASAPPGMARLGSVDVVVRTSRVCCAPRPSPAGDPGPLEGLTGLYTVVSLQPPRTLAGVVGYALRPPFVRPPAARQSASSNAAPLRPHNPYISAAAARASGAAVQVADPLLTVSRRLPLLADNLEYLRTGKALVAVFGLETRDPAAGGPGRKVFLGHVELPLGPAFSAGSRVAGWFLLADSPVRSYVYCDAAVQRVFSEEGDLVANAGAPGAAQAPSASSPVNWSVPEAPAPPTELPPEFSADTAVGERLAGFPAPSAAARPLPAPVAPPEGCGQANAESPRKASPAKLLQPEESFYDAVREIRMDTILGGLFSD